MTESTKEIKTLGETITADKISVGNIHLTTGEVDWTRHGQMGGTYVYGAPSFPNNWEDNYPNITPYTPVTSPNTLPVILPPAPQKVEIEITKPEKETQEIKHIWSVTGTCTKCGAPIYTRLDPTGKSPPETIFNCRTSCPAYVVETDLPINIEE